MISAALAQSLLIVTATALMMTIAFIAIRDSRNLVRSKS